MPTNNNYDALRKTLHKVITGRVSLELRKQLAFGESVSIKRNEGDLTIEVKDQKAFLKRGNEILVESAFVPWGEADDDYEAMIEFFSNRGEVDDYWFQRASSNFHSRFE